MRVVVFAAMIFAGCGTAAPTPTVERVPDVEFVRLLTAPGPPFPCPASLISGELVADTVAGTAIVSDDDRFPVRWPPGYVGRVLGKEIEVLDKNGVVVAVTGTRVELGGGMSESGVWLTCHGLIT
jgi:hypothetical protein